MTEWKKIYKDMIDDCLSADHISDWEREFLESIKKQFDEKDSLTSKQVTVLEQIYERVC